MAHIVPFTLPDVVTAWHNHLNMTTKSPHRWIPGREDEITGRVGLPQRQLNTAGSENEVVFSKGAGEYALDTGKPGSNRRRDLLHTGNIVEKFYSFWSEAKSAGGISVDFETQFMERHEGGLMADLRFLHGLFNHLDEQPLPKILSAEQLNVEYAPQEEIKAVDLEWTIRVREETVLGSQRWTFDLQKDSTPLLYPSNLGTGSAFKRIGNFFFWDTVSDQRQIIRFTDVVATYLAAMICAERKHIRSPDFEKLFDATYSGVTPSDHEFLYPRLSRLAIKKAQFTSTPTKTFSQAVRYATIDGAKYKKSDFRKVVGLKPRKSKIGPTWSSRTPIGSRKYGRYVPRKEAVPPKNVFVSTRPTKPRKNAKKKDLPYVGILMAPVDSEEQKVRKYGADVRAMTNEELEIKFPPPRSKEGEIVKLSDGSFAKAVSAWKPRRIFVTPFIEWYLDAEKTDCSGLTERVEVIYAGE